MVKLVIRPAYSIERKEFLVKEVKCYIPIEYDKYLTGRYGNWRVPYTSKGDWHKDAQCGSLFITWKFE